MPPKSPETNAETEADRVGWLEDCSVRGRQKDQGQGSGNEPLTKAQAQAVRDLTRSKLSNNDKNITKLSSEVKALSKRAIFSKDVLKKELLKYESAKIGSFKYSFAIFAGAGSVLLSTIAIALAMQH